MTKARDLADDRDLDEFNRVCDELIAELRRLKATYGMAYGAAFSGSRYGFTGAPARGSHSDPTGEVAVSGVHPKDGAYTAPRAALRGSLRRAAANLRKAQESIDKVDAGLTRSMKPIDPPPGPDLKLPDQYRISRAELADSKAAQDRRAERGEVPA